MLHTMEVLDPTGHLSLTWDPDKPDEVEKARAEFERLKSKGYVFFSVPVEEFDERAGALTVEAADVVDQPAETAKPKSRRRKPEGPVKEFEPRSERTVGVPQMRGG